MTFFKHFSKWLGLPIIPTRMSEAEFKALQQRNFKRFETGRKHYRRLSGAEANKELVTKALKGEL